MQPTFQPGKKWNKLSVERICADLVTVTNGDQFLSIGPTKNLT
jgi:hypothetical protein